MDDNRRRIATTIRVLGIKKTDLAQMADIKPCQISDYLRSRPLSEEKTQRLETSVENIARVWTSLGIKTDLSDVEGFGRLLAHVNQHETEQLANETAEFARIASRGLETSCSLTEQGEV
jgi:plasmid maintenance system antidote protein VapI